MSKPRIARKALTLDDQVKAINMYEKNPSSRKVGEAFGVSKDQIQKMRVATTIKQSTLHDYFIN